MKVCFKLLTLLILIITLTSGCTSSNNEPDDKLTIAVSIVPQETFVKAVAGDLVNVVTLIPPGQSPESYSPTPQIMQQFSNASIYFTVGVPAEHANILPRTHDLNKNIEIVHLEEKVAQEHGLRYFDEDEHHSHGTDYNHDSEHSHSAEGYDPHLWLSPKRVKTIINEISKSLSRMDSSNKETYEKNAQSYIEQLDHLDEKITNLLKDIPNKVFIINHPSLGYFADDYNLDMISLEEDGKEATAKGLQKKIDFARENNIKVIFYQAETDSRQVKAFADDIGAQTQMIEPLSSDYINNLIEIAQALAKQ